MQEKMQYYICNQNQVILHKESPQVCLIIVLKGKLQVKPTKSMKVGRIYEAGSIFGLVELVRQTGVAKTLIALEESIVAKIDIQSQEQGNQGQKIQDLIQRCLQTFKNLSFFSQLSEQNILRVIANSKIYSYMHQEEFKCSLEYYMIVLQGKFQRILYFEEDNQKIIDRKSALSFPKLQSNQGNSTSQEYNHGDLITTNHFQDVPRFNHSQQENDNEEKSDLKLQPKITNINSCKFQCKSESGILLQIHKTLFFKFTKFYQGMQINKPKRQLNIGQISIHKDSQNFSREKQIYIMKNNITDNTASKSFVKNIFINQKPETSSGRIQNYSVPKVDLDLFTRRSNVSPDQKQEFYECYSSRNEQNVKKSILRNYSELTFRKSKNSLFAQPNSNNYINTNNDHYNILQNGPEETAKMQMKQKQNYNFAQSAKADEFQTVLRLNQIMKSENEQEYYLKAHNNNQNIQKQESNNSKGFGEEKNNQSQYNFYNLQQNFQKGKSLIHKSLQSLSDRKQNTSVNQLLQQKPFNYPQAQIQKQQLSYQQLLQKHQLKNDQNKSIKNQIQGTQPKYISCQPYQLLNTSQSNEFISFQTEITFQQKQLSGQSNQQKNQSRKASVCESSNDVSLLTLNPHHHQQSLNQEQKQLWLQNIKDIKKIKSKNNSIDNQINNQENIIGRGRNLSRIKTEENDQSFKFSQKSMNELKKEQIFSHYNLSDQNNKTATFTNLPNTNLMNKYQIQKIQQKIQAKILNQQTHMFPKNVTNQINQNFFIEENHSTPKQQQQQQNLFTFYKNKPETNEQK